MPPVIKPRTPPRAAPQAGRIMPRMVPQKLAVEPRIAIALRSEVDRSTIPNRVALSTNAVPFAGELSEQQATSRPIDVPPLATVVLATLRRPWNYVGYAVDPGNVGTSLNANLRFLVRGMAAVNVSPSLAAQTIAAGTPRAVTGLIVGARCELIVTNPTEVTVKGVRGAIWGMSEA